MLRRRAGFCRVVRWSGCWSGRAHGALFGPLRMSASSYDLEWACRSISAAPRRECTHPEASLHARLCLVARECCCNASGASHQQIAWSMPSTGSPVEPLKIYAKPAVCILLRHWYSWEWVAEFESCRALKAKAVSTHSPIPIGYRVVTSGEIRSFNWSYHTIPIGYRVVTSVEKSRQTHQIEFFSKKN